MKVVGNWKLFIVNKSGMLNKQKEYSFPQLMFLILSLLHGYCA